MLVELVSASTGVIIRVDEATASLVGDEYKPVKGVKK